MNTPPTPSSATAKPDIRTPTQTSQSQTPIQTTEERIVVNAQSDSRNRERIAFVVLMASIAAVFFISFVVVRSAGNEKKEASQRVMGSTLPLYGTWVGTILAFYFSRNAFEAASNATARNAALFQQTNSSLSLPETPPDNTLAKILLKSLANDLVFRQEDINKPLRDILKELESKNRYRTIVVEAIDADKKTYEYVDLVYRINASAYLQQSKHEASDLQGEEGNPQVSPTIPEGSDPQGEEGDSQVSPTLNDYLDWRRKEGEKAQPIVVFLLQSATLADADAKLKETIGCRDVIVTTDGKETSPVVQRYPARVRPIVSAKVATPTY